MDNLLPRYADIISAASASGIVSDPTLGGKLVMDRAGPLSVSYAPFDHVNVGAKIVLVGITPGKQQAANALVEARKQLQLGKDMDAASRAAKETASFSGSMRQNLVDMLDRIGIHSCLGLAGCTSLFSHDKALVHYTSALRYPVFLNDANYAGNPGIATNPLLRRMVLTHLAAEAAALPSAIWIPLGPVPASALALLVHAGAIPAGNILDGLPHPSGANNERIAYFLGRKAKELLSKQTNPASLDRARFQLIDRVAGLSV